MSNQLTAEQIEAFLDRHRDPIDARKFLQEAGLIDENGELTEPYRPERVTLLSREKDPMNELRQASADVSEVELDPDWVKRAGRKKIADKVQAIFEAYSTEADRRDRSVSDSEMLAAALRETINQTQNGQGMISAAELYLIASQLDVAEDDTDLYLQQ